MISEYEINGKKEVKNKEGETNNIGYTFFVDSRGNEISENDFIIPDNRVLFINFPGSGLAVEKYGYDEVAHEQCREKAKEASVKTNALIAPHELDARFFTAVYEKKADLMIQEYNNSSEFEHAKDIFNRTIAPLFKEKDGNFSDYNTLANRLNKLFLRGHCFGCVVICELEKLLEAKLKECVKEHIFDDKQVATLLSLPKAFLSSPPLLLTKYPKYFKTTAIVSASDRTISGKGCCRRGLKKALMKKCGFKKKDLFHLTYKDVKESSYNPDAQYILPPVKIRDFSIGKNVSLYISNRSNFPSSYKELMKNINKKKGELHGEKLVKSIKKYLRGHEFGFLQDTLIMYFRSAMIKEYVKANISLSTIKQQNNLTELLIRKNKGQRNGFWKRN